MLEAADAGRVTLAPLAGAGADLAKARAVLAAADLVFVSGGDVEAGMQVLREREVIPLLRQLYQGGVTFVGISAGSIMLARQWVRWKDPDNDHTAELFSCLGFAPIWCDTHGEEEHWGELRVALALSADGTTGYGIPSGAGLIVEADGRVMALGSESAVFRKERSGVVQAAGLPPARETRA